MELIEKVKAIPYWYHRIELPDGIVTPGWAPICAEKYAIPDDLTGRRILDIGAWDGYWTFEALKRGAKEVVAIDDFSDNLGAPDKIKRKKWETFDLCREAFGFDEELGPNPHLSGWSNTKTNQICRRIEMSIYDISEDIYNLGRFDIVFFFGTLYHLRHPLLALDKITSVCDGELYIESAICDDFSPYHGGIEKGYRNNDMIAEFYPAKEYGNNSSNWWVPTLQTLGYMVQTSGFENIEMWRLTENPKGPEQCRGFVWAGREEPENENIRKWTQTAEVLHKAPKVAAVMSVPRLGFNVNREAVFDVLKELKISLRHVYGAFWGQSLEGGLQTEIDNGADLILTIDYDTLFLKEDLQEMIALMAEHPEVDALIPWQMKRGGGGPLCTMRSKTGQRIRQVPMENFKDDLSVIATGHFGLTLIRAESLMKMPHPWFLAEPDKDGQWGRDRTDADIYFWRKFAAAGNTASLANRVTIGHLELMATWPDRSMEPIYQSTGDFHDNGKPKNVWR